MNFVFTLFIALIPISASGYPCAPDPLWERDVKVLEELEPNELCKKIAETVSSESHKCIAGMTTSENFRLSVTRTIGPVPEFDVFVFAHSSWLSRKYSSHGYESHKIKFIAFIALTCEPRVLIYFHEPRYHLGPLSAAQDEGNSNWKLFADGERLKSLELRLRESFVTLVIEKDDEK